MEIVSDIVYFGAILAVVTMLIKLIKMGDNGL